MSPKPFSPKTFYREINLKETSLDKPVQLYCICIMYNANRPLYSKHLTPTVKHDGRSVIMGKALLDNLVDNILLNQKILSSV